MEVLLHKLIYGSKPYPLTGFSFSAMKNEPSDSDYTSKQHSTKKQNVAQMK